LKWLSIDRDIDVRELVASNPNTPISVLRSLLNDDDGIIMHRARRNLKENWGVEIDE